MEFSEATKILILLSNNFDENSLPVSPSKLRNIITLLNDKDISLTELKSQNHKLLLEIESKIGLDKDQITHQLSYGMRLALKIDEWKNLGIWCISTLDIEQFPLKLLSKARQKINPLLFGSGDLSILSKPSVGIVGSRDISDNTLQYVHKAVEKFTDNNISIMSGGAKGVDLAAMNHALELGHCVIGVLPSELNKSLRDIETIRYISEGQLLLLSPEMPESHWTIGRAMARNKYIYILSDGVLVGQISKPSGGTWTGIQECSKNSWNKIYIKSQNLDLNIQKQLLQLRNVELDKNLSIKELLAIRDIEIEHLSIKEVSAHLNKSVAATKSYITKNNLSCLDYPIDKKPKKNKDDIGESKQSELF